MMDKKDNDKEQTERPRLTEMVRELSLTALAAFFMTEDSVRNYLKELKLPKELVSLLLDGISKKKDDFYALLAKEFGQMLSKFDLGTELGKFLSQHKIHFEAKVSFEPKAGGEKG
ncbi:MAG: hypothetical protein HY537_04060 [Deltaproteobacteria bacterium]|nr:hypothetical protein [Deltaproteobacteria bacterium]